MYNLLSNMIEACNAADQEQDFLEMFAKDHQEAIEEAAFDKLIESGQDWQTWSTDPARYLVVEYDNIPF